MRTTTQLLFFMSILLIFSCEESIVDEQDLGLNTEDFSNLYYNNLKLPEGTVGIYSADRSSVRLELPDNIKYIANNDNSFIITSSGSYTCTSKCSPGCDVVKLGDDIGCSACPKTSKEDCIGSHGKTTSGNLIGDGEGGGFIDLDLGITFSQKSDILNQLDAPQWDVLIKHPEVNKKFEEFYSSYWPSGIPDYKNSKSIVVNIYGVHVKLLMPSNLDYRADTVSGDEVTCACNSGTEGCIHEEINVKIGFINKKVGDKCVAGACTSCKMSF